MILMVSIRLMTHFECFSAIMDFRKANLDAFVKKYGIKLGFMSVFCKAAAYALQDQPVVNAVIDGNVSLAWRSSAKYNIVLICVNSC